MGCKFGDAIDQKAAPWAPFRIGQSLHHRVHRVIFSGFGNFLQATDSVFGIMLQRSQKQRLLAAESGVKTGTAKPHCLGEIVQRRRFEALLPENMHGRLKRRRFIEAARPARTCRAFLRAGNMDLCVSHASDMDYAVQNARGASLISGPIVSDHPNTWSVQDKITYGTNRHRHRRHRRRPGQRLPSHRACWCAGPLPQYRNPEWETGWN